MIPQDPNTFAHKLEAQHRQWVQSAQQTLTGGVDMGTPSSKDSTGQYNKFDKGNGSGNLIRIGATGSTGNDYTWPSAGPLVINHKLLRQPIGCHIVSSDKDLRVWQPSAPDKDSITLTPSDHTANATVYVF